jgi:prepilin-type N-terminal cleavage/methylation domain-containing protein
MKFPIPAAGDQRRVTAPRGNALARRVSSAACEGFTMVEIAISLAIIGIALVSIIGVLPIGMRTQKDNREETIINQDATVLLQDISKGVKGDNDLTNYVYAITNTWTEYDPNGTVAGMGTNGYTYLNFSGTPAPPAIYSQVPINSGTNIIGLLTTPLFQALDGSPNPPGDGEYFSNHVVAYVYSISGPAVEKPPQAPDSLIRQSSFAYRVLCENMPAPASPPDTPAGAEYGTALQNNLYELRLAFFWPQQPNGVLGHGYQTFRTMVAGQLVPDFFQTNLYFFQPQSFTSAGE